MAALRLATEHGLENVRTDDIAAAAGVSPRTFRNYFANKYEAIVSRHLDRTRQTASSLRARPADEPLWEALTGATLETFGNADATGRDPREMSKLRLLLAEPALRAEVARTAVAADNELTLAIAERTGTDPVNDIYPRLVASTVSNAEHLALDHWLHADPPVPLLPVIEEALRQVAAGLPEPRPSTKAR